MLTRKFLVMATSQNARVHGLALSCLVVLFAGTSPGDDEGPSDGDADGDDEDDAEDESDDGDDDGPDSFKVSADELYKVPGVQLVHALVKMAKHIASCMEHWVT